MSHRPNSVRARKRAGWRHVTILVPPERHERARQIAGKYRLSIGEVARQAYSYGLDHKAAADWGRVSRAESAWAKPRGGRVRAIRRARVAEPLESPTSPPVDPS